MYFYFPRAVVIIPIQTNIFAMTLISHDDHFASGAWDACGYSVANLFSSLSSTIVRLASVIY